MKKNYIAPKTRVIAVAAQMICASVEISNNTTSSQWSRGGGNWEDDEDYE